MSGLFREKALQKRESREQLNRMLMFVRPPVFLAIIGGVMMVIAILLWGFYGTIPQFISALCIGIEDEGTDVLLVSEEEVYKVKPGMKIIFSNNVTGIVDSISDNTASTKEILNIYGSVPDEIKGHAVVIVKCTCEKYIEKDNSAKILLGEAKPLEQWISVISTGD